MFRVRNYSETWVTEPKLCVSFSQDSLCLSTSASFFPELFWDECPSSSVSLVDWWHQSQEAVMKNFRNHLSQQKVQLPGGALTIYCPVNESNNCSKNLVTHLREYTHGGILQPPSDVLWGRTSEGHMTGRRTWLEIKGLFLGPLNYNERDKTDFLRMEPWESARLWGSVWVSSYW